MNEPSTSLDRLHDIVVPPEVPWWPPAPGWYAVLVLLLLVGLRLAWRASKQWKANAYRRAALRELAAATDAVSIAGVLRRAALVIAPRQEIAATTGKAWPEWLDRQCPGTLSAPDRDQLAGGIYARPAKPADLESLRNGAVRWIRQHARAEPPASS